MAINCTSVETLEKSNNLRDLTIRLLKNNIPSAQTIRFHWTERLLAKSTNFHNHKLLNEEKKHEEIHERKSIVNEQNWFVIILI